MTEKSIINPETALQVANLGVNFVPGPLGYAGSIAMSGVSGKYEGQKRIEELAEQLGMTRSELESKAGHSRAYQNYLQAAQNASVECIKQNAAGLTGSALAAAALGLVTLPALPLVAPAALIGASFVGGTAGTWAYGKFKGEVDQRALEAVQQMQQLREQGQPVPQEMVYTALVENLHDEKLAARIKSGVLPSEEIDNILRAATEMPIDYTSQQGVVGQYTDLINSGAINPYAVLLNRDSNTMLMEMIRQRQQMQQITPTSLHNRPVIGEHTARLAKQTQQAETQYTLGA